MSGGKPLDETYFNYLADIVTGLGPLLPFHHDWLLGMYKTPFEFFIPNDQNRAEDGLEIRQTFLLTNQLGVSRDRDWEQLPCSMLEMLMALSDRACFESSRGSSDWLWLFLHNLGVTTGRVTITNALRKLNRRTYAADGSGGLFPLKNPHQDQRKVELWYQMAAYLLENETY